MNKIFKGFVMALALGSAASASARSTMIYHSDGSRDVVVTDDATGRTDVYRNNGDGWRWQGYHGEAHPHWDVVNRRTGSDDSVGDYREARPAREPRQIEPREPREPREYNRGEQ